MCHRSGDNSVRADVTSSGLGRLYDEESFVGWGLVECIVLSGADERDIQAATT